MAPRGTLFGYAVESAFAHTRLSPAPAVRGTLEIDSCPRVVLDPSQITHHDAGNDAAFTIARLQDGSLAVACSAAGGFRIDAAVMCVWADRNAISDEIWEHRLVTVVIPLLLADAGDIALHAAAVVRDGRAVAFAGASTSGKSTLAFAAAELGLGVLADDGVVIEIDDGASVVWPGPAGVRVAPPGRQGKQTLFPGGVPARGAPLAAVVLLGPLGATHLLQPVSAVEAVPALVPSLIFSGRDRLAEALRDAAVLAARVPVLRCSMPRGAGLLPVALTTVLDRVLSGAGA